MDDRQYGESIFMSGANSMKNMRQNYLLTRKKKMSFVCAMPKQDVIGIRSENS